MADDSILTGILGLAGGWMLGEVSALARFLYKRRELDKALQEEVAELHDTGSIRVWLSLARSLQMNVNGGVDNSFPLPLGNEVYKHHYSEILKALNRWQRPAIEMLYQYVEQTNVLLDRLRALRESVRDKDTRNEVTEEDVTQFGEELRAAMHGVACVQWHAKYYLNHPMLPDLGYRTSAHKQYVIYLEKVQAEMTNIETSGKGISREKFEQIYQPEFFDPIPDE